MRYQAFATDYDGTVAWDGAITDATFAALRRLKNTGRRLFLVTGRDLEELLAICPHVATFDRVVAENGGLVYRPDTKQSVALAKPPPEALVQALRQAEVDPLSVGRVLLATVEPYHKAALEAIHKLGLEYQVIFNKGSVMILPSGVTKATGLHAVLAELGLSRDTVVGIGDAENDHSFIGLCGLSIAVANALPALKARADFVTTHACGAGVAEAIDMLVANEFAGIEPKACNHDVAGF